MTESERITALEARLAKAEARIAELEGRMPLGVIGPLYAKPDETIAGYAAGLPPTHWLMPKERVPGAVIYGGDTEVTKTGDCTAEIRDKRWLGTV